MKHIKYFLMALLFITGFISNVYAAGDDRDIYDDGYNRVASDGSVIHRTNTTCTTGETVDYGYDTYTTTSMTAQGGSSSGGKRFKLPTAQSGVRMTFLLDKAFQIELDPVSGALFPGYTDVAGDSLVLNPTTGNSVTIHAVNDTTWVVISKIGGIFDGE